MPPPHRDTVLAISLLICLSITLGEAKKETDTPICPIGFDLAYTGYEKPICYRLKGSEAFKDIFEDCAGNLYTSELYHSLNITKPNVELWSGHKSLYPGGPFIDWSFSPSIGKVLTSTYDVKYNPSLGIDEELCVVIHPVNNFTAVRCTEKHYRYCMVEPYEDTLSKCEELTDYYRFWSPKATCLTPVTVKGGKVRASWSQAQILCSKRGGSLLHRGWRYANNPLLHINKTDWTDPLGVEATAGDELRWVIDEDGNDKVPDSESLSLEVDEYLSNNSLLALRDNAWHLVNSTYIFMDVICERSIHLRNVSLNLTVEGDHVILSVNDSVDESNIHCYTDAILYSPTNISKIALDDNKYRLKTVSDGMYWCIHRDSRNFRVSQSNKVLFVREKHVENLYAIKIRLRGRYRFENIDKQYRVWERKVKEYIYYRTKYVERFGEITTTNGHEAEGLLQSYKRSTGDDSGEGSFKETDVIYMVKIKRLFLDGRTVLLHVQLNPTMKVVPPGYWEGLEVMYMRPAFFCAGDGLPGIKRVALGQSVITTGCRNHTCTGDFNTGVSFVITQADDCSMPSRTVTTKDTNITVFMPTAEPKTTTVEEQLQQVLQDLEAIINNDTISIMMDTASDAVEQVDALLDMEDELEIPGQLLHLVDELAARVDLNGSHQAQAIANNIAMLMADSSPESPVKGLRIAAQGTGGEVFSADAFEIISEEVNATHLYVDESEAVVHLPESVNNSSRRISFVVFRNDRAFMSSHGLYSVNSRVLSIKIEDLTQFADGEVIDIHLRPLAGDLERNQTRSCAYWHFLDDDSGYWSEDGCTFIPSSQSGQLDTCRCDHLTHFAEVLVPKTVFSERNEAVLEVLSIVGCVLSIFGLLCVGITAAIFRSWRRDFSNKIWLQLCIAIFILIVCFLVVVFAHFDHYDVTCLLLGVLLHYSVLASFCWMLVAAVLSYRRLVLVFTRDASHKLLRASAFSWGTPCAIVGILLAASPHAYSGQFEEMSPSSSFCYPSGLGLWLTVYAPIAIMLLANWMLFVLIVRSVFASRRIQRHGDSNEALRCASVSCLLVFLFGLPWIFGLFASNIVAAYLFTLTATFQGFVLFIFFVLGNKKTRDLWLNKLKIKQTQKIPVTSSTYTNNKSQNSASEWRKGRSTPATIEANASKPRSLSSPDESRFS
ncbi:adhesion G-protein coupled receptor G6-like isoform X2 [Cydia splendana]|uniref:adhesion G-protein coupled receptor G6-like isoform X2 n=1 Tax=Cydia splendana TaxID=1100963 RepID=UPI002129A540